MVPEPKNACIAPGGTDTTEDELVLEKSGSVRHVQYFSGQYREYKETYTDLLLYQYRTTEGFWAIINSDSLWLTNARFSNDYKEQVEGANKITKSLEKYEQGCKGRIAIEDCYISCFCREGDKLSQWRGYAPEGGVAIGFDFATIRPFAIVEEAEKAEKLHQEMNACYKVRYSTESEIDEAVTSLQQYGIQKSNEADFTTMIPFIKHSAFMEEDEWRLVFINKNDKYEKAIRYRKSNNGINVPYIVVQAGGAYEKDKSIVRVLTTDENAAASIQKRITDEKIAGCVLCCQGTGTGNDDLCYGCTTRIQAYLDRPASIRPCAYKDNLHPPFTVDVRSCGVYISQGKNQEAVCREVRKILHEEKSTLKVWCDGHLPIRKLIVGPSPDQEYLCESIKHNCSNRFWLKDVEVCCSEIPYRKC